MCRYQRTCAYMVLDVSNPQSWGYFDRQGSWLARAPARHILDLERPYWPDIDEHCPVDSD